MRICVLHPSYEGASDEDTELDPPCSPAPYMRHRPDLEFETVDLARRTSVAQLKELVRGRRYDVFFNLCDGTWEDAESPGLEVVRALEILGVPFTGADSRSYEPTKEQMKRAAVAAGVPTPAYSFVFGPEQIEEAAAVLELPVIVKHFHGCGSIGLSRESVCYTTEELRGQAESTIARFGAALVEEFVAGREATVLVLENPLDPRNPLALTPVECVFPAGEEFKHYYLKWWGFEGMSWQAVDGEALAGRLRELAARMFVALDGVSFARCDFRIRQRDGEVLFLEINPNCGVLYPPDAPGSADSVLSVDPLGHAGFIEHLIDCALRRHQRRQDSWVAPAVTERLAVR